MILPQSSLVSSLGLVLPYSFKPSAIAWLCTLLIVVLELSGKTRPGAALQE